MTESADYNYSHFGSGGTRAMSERFDSDGPRVGTVAPEFSVEALSGGTVRKNQFLGRPLVLEFGSYTCPIFINNVDPMEELARAYPKVTFVVVYTREAHPGEVTPAHKSMEEKREAGRRLAAEGEIGRLIALDDLEGRVHLRYGAGGANPVYLIDAGGTVAFRSFWNDPGELYAAMLTEVGPPDWEPVLSSRPRHAGEELLQRGGRQALVDFYISRTPERKQAMLDAATSAVRGVILGEHGDGIG